MQHLKVNMCHRTPTVLCPFWLLCPSNPGALFRETNRGKHNNHHRLYETANLRRILHLWVQEKRVVFFIEAVISHHFFSAVSKVFSHIVKETLLQRLAERDENDAIFLVQERGVFWKKSPCVFDGSNSSGSVCKLRSDWLVPFHIQCPETKHPPCAYRDRYEGQCPLLVLQPSAVLKRSQQCCDESTDKVVGDIAAFFLSIKRRPSIRFQGRWRNWRTPDDIFVSVELDTSPYNSMLFILVTLPLARNVVVKWQKASGTLHMKRSFCTSTFDFGTA